MNKLKSKMEYNEGTLSYLEVSLEEGNKVVSRIKVVSEGIKVEGKKIHLNDKALCN